MILKILSNFSSCIFNVKLYWFVESKPVYIELETSDFVEVVLSEILSGVLLNSDFSYISDGRLFIRSQLLKIIIVLSLLSIPDLLFFFIELVLFISMEWLFLELS